VLTRRTLLASAGIEGITLPARVQPESDDLEVALLAADAGPVAMQTAESIVARLSGGAGGLHAEPSQGVADSVGRINQRNPAIVSVLPSNALAYMVRAGVSVPIARAVRLIGRLDVLVLQVLVQQGIGEMRQLEGQRVNLGPRGSPTEVTMSLLLQRASLRVDPLYLDHDQALVAMLRRQIPAMAMVGPTPAGLFFALSTLDRLHLLPVNDPGGSATGQFPVLIMPEDYPGFVAEDGRPVRPVETVGVPLVLGCYGWAPETFQCMAVSRVADLLAEHGSGLPGFDMGASVAGWKRFAPVSNWLDHGQDRSIRDYALMQRRAADPRPRGIEPRKPTPESNQSTSQNPGTSEPNDRLFQQFMRWRRDR
jgi:hypothetical protein